MTAARKLARPEAYIETGTVSRADDTIEVILSTGTHEAKRAKSCLCAVESGDSVLCAVDGARVFVLAVLEGREGAPTKIVAEGDLDLAANGGRVGIAADRGVALTTPGDLAMSSRSMHVRAEEGSIAIEELGFLGRLVQAEVTKVTLLARDLDTVVTRLTQRAKRVFRFVEEIDQTRAGTVDMRAENLVGIRGENAIIAARVLAKVDAKQVNLG